MVIGFPRPAHNIPPGKASASAIQKLDEHHPRIEEAFQNIFYRAPEPKDLDTNNEGSATGEEAERHEYEIIVCHANVIRYFFCR